jgi:hypothetical protein
MDMAVTSPTVGMRDSVDDRRTIADRVVTVQIGVVIAASVVVVIAVGVGIIAPPWISGADEYGGGKSAAPVAIAVTVSRAVRSADRCRRIIGVIRTRCETNGNRSPEYDTCPVAKIFLHGPKTS